MVTRELIDDRLKFNQKKHIYKVGKTQLTSVTKWVSSFFPEFDAKEQAKKSNANSRSKYYKMGVRKILSLWKARSDSGTETHSQIEGFLTGKYIEIEITDKKAKIALAYLNKKFEGYSQYPEIRVYSEDLCLAGTIDLVVTCGKTVVLVDWKTNEEISLKEWTKNPHPAMTNVPNTTFHKYCLQLGTYAHILEKEYGYSVDQLILIHLKEDSFEEFIVKKEIIQIVVQKMIEYKEEIK